MKKFLSILLAVMMLVGTIVPSLAVGAAEEGISVVASGAEYVATGASEFTTTVSLAGNPGNLGDVTLFAWWNVSDKATLTASYDTEVFDSTLSSVATGVGASAACKTYAAIYGVADRSHQCAVITLSPINAIEGATVENVANITFTFAAPIEAGTTFTYNIAVVGAVDFDFNDLAYSTAAVECVNTFIADQDYVALCEKYAGQVLTIAANDVTFNKDTDTTATLKIYMLNNDEDDSNKSDFVEGDKNYSSGIGVWGMKYVLVYDQALVAGNATNSGLIFEDSAMNFGEPNRTEDDQLAVDACQFAFQSFNFDIKGSGKNFYILSVIPDDATKCYYGNGLLATVPFTLPENARVGTTYTIQIMSDLEDDVSNITNWSIPFQTAAGSITVTGTPVECTHVNTKDVVVTEPTCTVPGSKNVVCVDCDAIVEEGVEIPALGHGETSEVTVIEATCTEDGSKKTVCNVCGLTVEEGIVIPALGHDIVTIPAVDATCTAAGATEGTGCSRCDYVETAPTEIPALGHDEGTWTVKTPATTTEAGLEELICGRCGAVLDSREIPMITTPAIAVADGTAYAGRFVSVPVTISNNHGIWALKATFTSADMVLAAVESGLFTVTEDNFSFANGVTTVFVDADGIENIAENGTLFTLVFAVPEETGTYTLTADVQELVNAEGADLVFDIDAEAAVTVNACEHNYVGVVTTPATIDAEGVMTYTCSVCGKSYNEPIPMLTSAVVGAAESAAKGKTVKVPVTLNNNYGLWSMGMTVAFDAEALEFTGLESGLFTVDENSASAADGTVKIFVDAADINNITDNGVAFYICFKVITNVPGTVDLVATVVDELTINAASENVVVVAVNGAVEVVACEHANTETVNAAVATCVTEGYTGDVVCTDCGDVVTRGDVISVDSENHEGEEVEATAAITATCVTEGFTASTKCSACDAILTPAVSLGYDAENHEGEEVEATAAITATCVTEGFTASTKCSACDAILTPAVSLGLDAENHEGEIVWTVITPPTATEEGLKEGKCGGCGVVLESVVIEARTFIKGFGSTEKVRSLSLDNAEQTITVYSRNFADYVMFAVSKTYKTKIVAADNAELSHEYHPDFSYITVRKGDSSNATATITVRDAEGYEGTYTINVIFSEGGLEVGYKMLGYERTAENAFTVYAPADRDVASFRFVFEIVGYTFGDIEEGCTKVVDKGISWFKIANDGTNTVTKTITTIDPKGVENVITVTVQFGD